MYNLKFQTALADKIGLDLDIVRDIFENESENEFDAALILIEKYKIDSAIIGKIWASHIGFAYVDPNTSIVNQEYIQKAGIKFILDNKALPLYKFGRAITVSTPNPTNPFLQDKMEKKLEDLVSLVFCFPFDIEKYLKKNNLQ